MTFTAGDPVFLRSAGLGRVVGFAAKDAAGRPSPWRAPDPPAFYVVEVADQVACVPLSAAGETLRTPVAAETARQMLEVLRGPAPDAVAEPLLERGKKVAHSGSPLEHARLLRELCGLPVPLSEAFASGLSFYAQLVLPEVAQVLGVGLEALREELQGRYPAVRDAARGTVRFHSLS